MKHVYTEWPTIHKILYLSTELVVGCGEETLSDEVQTSLNLNKVNYKACQHQGQIQDFSRGGAEFDACGKNLGYGESCEKMSGGGLQ